MRSILVNADNTPDLDTQLETALDLARTAGGHVTVLVDTPVSRYVAMDPMGGSYVLSDILTEACAKDDARAEQIIARLSRGDVAFDVIRSEAELLEALTAAARLADLTVVSRASSLGGQLALMSRTPVLVLGHGVPLSATPNTVCIGWDGGEQAAIALRSAVPLLAASKSVTLLTVAEKPGGFPATDALRYLSRHGIHAELEELQRRGSVEETIAVAVARHGADLLVMGAYGKSRLREFLFGGVTAYFLSEPEGPALLLAH